MASLGKLVTLFVVILVAAEGEAQSVPSYFSLYGSPSVNTYPPSKASSPTPSTYPSPSAYPASQNSATNYPNSYPPASYPSNAYTPPGYNTQATAYNQQAPGYNQQATGYNQQATGYNQQAPGYNQQATGYNQPAQSGYNYVYPSNTLGGPYSAPLAPQYVAPYQSYPSGYNYNYNMNSNCTDQSCKPTECCEFNGKRFVCVEQNQDLLQTEINGYGVYCARAKRCYSNGDCPANHCCVIRLDIPYDNSQYGSYGSQNSYGSYGSQNSYGSYGNYGAPNLKTERGECLLYAAVNSTCRRPVEGSATSSCPCVSGTTCTFSVINPLTGICQTPSG